jgi:hypothetical protein
MFFLQFSNIVCGADTIVYGTVTIFRPHEDTISNKIAAFRETFN